MARELPKRPCAVAGCHAWTKHGESLCAPHLRSRAMQQGAALVLPLLRAVATPAPEAPLDDVQLIDEELRRLLTVRRFFVAWVEELRADPTQRGFGPAQFLRAWNDSTARVIALLRARRELGSSNEDELGALMENVLGELEERLSRGEGQPK
jgi:hypothetical protein